MAANTAPATPETPTMNAPIWLRRVQNPASDSSGAGASIVAVASLLARAVVTFTRARLPWTATWIAWWTASDDGTSSPRGVAARISATSCVSAVRT